MTNLQDTTVPITNLVDEIVVSMMNCRVYPATHPRVTASVQEIRRHLGELATSTGQKSVTLGVIDGCLVHGDRPLLDASMSSKRLIQAIQERGADALQIDCNANEDEIRALMATLGARKDDATTVVLANQKLASVGCAGARMLEVVDAAQSPTQARNPPAGEAPPKPEVAPKLDDKVLVPLSLYQSAVDLLQGLTITICQGGSVGFQGVQSVIEGVLQVLARDAKDLLGIARYEKYDAYTFGHSIRVCVLALNFARTLTDDQQLLNRIGVAALLHDIGKAKVPFEVLHCRTRLSPEQRLEMEKHPALGAAILLDNGGADPLAVAAAFGHHQVPGVGGYPRVQHKHELSLVTKIVKLCDVYEALTAVRPYKDAMSPLRAFRIMISMQDQFDPELLRRFIAATGVYPTGSPVELSDGSKGRVHKQTEVIDRPIVEVELVGGQHQMVDLSHPEIQAKGLKVTQLG